MEQNLTRGNLWKQIFVFRLPLMISNLLQVLFNMADIAVCGSSAVLGFNGITLHSTCRFDSVLVIQKI